MPAPTAADGAARGIEESTVPSVFAILAVIMAYYFYGGIVAGLLLLGITVLGLVVLASLAKYWNVAYTIGFVAFSFLGLLMIPSVLGELVDPLFSILSKLAVLFAIPGIAFLLLSKLDLNISISR